MPLAYTIDRESQVVFVLTFGVLTESDLTKLARGLSGEPGFDPGMPSLADRRLEKDVEVGTRFLREYQSAFDPTAPRAVVLGSKAQFRMSRLYRKVSLQKGSLYITRDLAAALEWLGLPPGTVFPVVGYRSC